MTPSDPKGPPDAIPVMYYEDLEVGDLRLSEPRTVTEQEIIAFARQYDPQYFHCDPVAARDHPWGQVAASGIHSLALWRRLDHEITGNIRWICGVSWENLRWMHPLHPQDQVRARFELIEKRPSSKPGRGVVVCDYGLLNQRDAFIFRCRSINLVQSRPPPGASES